jgi:hypothetical protein
MANFDTKLQIASVLASEDYLNAIIDEMENVKTIGAKRQFIYEITLYELIKNFVKTILKISLKAKSLNENKYNHIIKFLDAYVYNNQNDLDKFKERNGPSNIYDDKQLKLLESQIEAFADTIKFTKMEIAETTDPARLKYLNNVLNFDINFLQNLNNEYLKMTQ